LKVSGSLTKEEKSITRISLEGYQDIRVDGGERSPQGLGTEIQKRYIGGEARRE